MMTMPGMRRTWASVPVLLADACGAGSEAAGARLIETLRFLGETVITDVDTFSGLIGRLLKSG
jgi:hypothetical protein